MPSFLVREISAIVVDYLADMAQREGMSRNLLVKKILYDAVVKDALGQAADRIEPSGDGLLQISRRLLEAREPGQPAT